jgi:hypothetical protein
LKKFHLIDVFQLATTAAPCPSTSTQIPFPLMSTSSGAFIKNVCLIGIAKTQSEADAACKAGSTAGTEMKLFQIDSDDTQTAIFAVLEANLGSQGYNYAFRVDGLRDTSDGQWYYHNSGSPEPAFSNLKWYMTSDTLEGFDSLAITNMAWPASKVVPSVAVDGIQSDNDLVPVLCQY